MGIVGIVIAILIFLFCPVILIGLVASAFVQVVLQAMAIMLAVGAFFLLLCASRNVVPAKKLGVLVLLAFFLMLLAPLAGAVRAVAAGDAGLGAVWTALMNIGPLLGMVASTGALLLLFSLREVNNLSSPLRVFVPTTLFSIGLIFNAFSMYVGANFSPMYASEFTPHIIFRLLYIACLLGAYISAFKFSVWRTENRKDRRLALAIPASLVLWP